MKSSYELAMERLSKTAPTTKLTAKQKVQIAELESEYSAKIAGREIALKAEIAKVANQPDQAEQLSQQLAFDRKKLQSELEDKKERVRAAK
jgi:ABC-type hemin transport system substrate-binding protein